MPIANAFPESNLRSSASPERDAIRSETAALLEGAVDDLPEHLRVVFVLREIEGMSTAETAACLDLTEDNVKVRLHRSRAHLKRELEAQLGNALRNTFAYEAPRCNRLTAAVMSRIPALPCPRADR